ncbi:hypothetical protein [Algoriphagus sp. CAU 1675]|uniref:hypothetical protein n=1 Tax=Algoriphagus sp. CAU 1675 TaxID=3032597 RepID=UPI0023DAFD58|nr:hypothetical protein [Algoriphagus sp. CAU 1675]MDF2159086.1 hypothetical protein [Algoriphagus sp. CAU 1675]
MPKDGYIETFLVNETSENVWFDQFRILSTGPVIVQETHGACPDECSTAKRYRESLGSGIVRTGLPVWWYQGESPSGS